MMTDCCANRRSAKWRLLGTLAILGLLLPLGAVADDVYEENDSPESAKSIPTDQRVSGLSSEDDDWYRFSLGGCRHARVRILFSHAAGNLNAEMFDRRCVEPGETGYKVGESYSTTDNEEMTYVNVTAAAELFVKVYHEGGTGAVSYSIEVTTIASDDSLELVQGTWSNDSGCPGDWWGNLPAVQVGTRYDGLIARDDDWYKVDVSGWNTIQVWVEHHYYSGDLNVEVREAVDGTCWPAVIRGSYGRDPSASAESLSEVWVAGRNWVLVRVYGETRQTNFYSLTVSGQERPAPTATPAPTLTPSPTPTTTPIPPSDLSEAVDNISLEFTTGGDAAWFRETTTSYAGGDAAQSGDVGPSQGTWIETIVEGPGTLNFRWKVSCEPDFDALLCALDHTFVIGAITGEVNWTERYIHVPPGAHLVSWLYVKDDSVDAGADCGWVDGVIWTPSNVSPNSALADAVDNTSLSFTTGGNRSWSRQTATSVSEGDAAQSGDIGEMQLAWMGTTVNGPGTLNFYWKASSEQDWDFLVAYLDSEIVSGISGEQDWTSASIPVPAGTHKVTWMYAKDESTSAGSDCGWVDGVVWIPGP